MLQQLLLYQERLCTIYFNYIRLIYDYIFYRKHLSTFVQLSFGVKDAWSELLSIIGSTSAQLISSNIDSLSLQILPRIANNLSHAVNSKKLFQEINTLLAANNIQVSLYSVLISSNHRELADCSNVGAGIYLRTIGGTLHVINLIFDKEFLLQTIT